ncbi:MAG: NUDIX domain-containing protein [Pseudomonadota bacterium]
MSRILDAYFSRIAAQGGVRVRAVALALREGRVLAQQPSDDPSAFYAFPGGQYEAGDSFESRVRAEIAEETTAAVVSARYGFVVENRFEWRGSAIHLLEHYVFVTLDRADLVSREAHLRFVWLPLAGVRAVDLRPHVVRDLLGSERLESARRLEGPFNSIP